RQRWRPRKLRTLSPQSLYQRPAHVAWCKEHPWGLPAPLVRTHSEEEDNWDWYAQEPQQNPPTHKIFSDDANPDTLHPRQTSVCTLMVGNREGECLLDPDKRTSPSLA